MTSTRDTIETFTKEEGRRQISGGAWDELKGDYSFTLLQLDNFYRVVVRQEERWSNMQRKKNFCTVDSEEITKAGKK